MANGALSTGNPLKWIDYLRFGWFDPLMKLGALTTLQKEDIWYTEPRDLPENIVAELEPLWNREVERARGALCVVLRRPLVMLQTGFKASRRGALCASLLKPCQGRTGRLGGHERAEKHKAHTE